MPKVRALNVTRVKPDKAEAGPRDGNFGRAQPYRQDDTPLPLAYVPSLLAANLKLLLIGPLVAGILAFAIASFLPRSYTSVAYLSVDEAGAQAIDARMRSIPVTDAVLSHGDVPGTSAQARRDYIARNTRIMVAPGLVRKTARLYRMEYSDRSPESARTIHLRLLEAWLESTKPGPDERAASETEIRRLDAQAKSMQTLIGELEDDMREPALRTSRGTFAQMIVTLSIRQDETLARLAALRSSLNGVSRDIVAGEPTLPDEPSWPNTAVIVILTVAATSLVLPILLMVGPPLRRLLRRARTRHAGGPQISP